MMHGSKGKGSTQKKSAKMSSKKQSKTGQPKTGNLKGRSNNPTGAAIAYSMPTKASRPGKIKGTTKSLEITAEFLIGQIAGTYTAGQTIFDLPINPGIIDPGPLVPYGQVWDKFVVQQAEFEYRPLCGTTTTGGYVMWCESNPSTPMPLSNLAAVALAHAGAVEFNVWKPATCRMRKTGQDQRYFCQPTPDVAEYQQGHFRMAALTAVTGGVGSVVCRMTIKFYNPQLNLADGVGRTLGVQNTSPVQPATNIGASTTMNLGSRILVPGAGVNTSTGELLQLVTSVVTPNGTLSGAFKVPEQGTLEVVDTVAAQGAASSQVDGTLWPPLKVSFYDGVGFSLAVDEVCPVSWTSIGVTPPGSTAKVPTLFDQLTYALPGVVWMVLNQVTPSSGDGWTAAAQVFQNIAVSVRNKDANPYGGYVVDKNLARARPPAYRRGHPLLSVATTITADGGTATCGEALAERQWSRLPADSPALAPASSCNLNTPSSSPWRAVPSAYDHDLAALLALADEAGDLPDRHERLKLMTKLLHARYGPEAEL
jgi:hypothetical protein